MSLKLIKPIWESKFGKKGFIDFMGKERKIRLLDVGCGNGSPFWYKMNYPDHYYVGLDILDYNQSSHAQNIADKYIKTSPSNFAKMIENMGGEFDAVISSHNIEHCNEPERVIYAMINALKKNGMLYISTPCKESIHFPSRSGCLNFFDDATHKIPVDCDKVIELLKNSGGQILVYKKRYRPIWLALKGLICEPYSALKKRVNDDGSTWALWGFETIIWFKK